MNIFYKNIYLITFFYYLTRWFYLKVIIQRAEIYKWQYEINVSIIGTLLSICAYYCFITKITGRIFPTADEFK